MPESKTESVQSDLLRRLREFAAHDAQQMTPAAKLCLEAVAEIEAQNRRIQRLADNVKQFADTVGDMASE